MGRRSTLILNRDEWLNYKEVLGITEKELDNADAETGFIKTAQCWFNVVDCYLSRAPKTKLK